MQNPESRRPGSPRRHPMVARAAGVASLIGITAACTAMPATGTNTAGPSEEYLDDLSNASISSLGGPYWEFRQIDGADLATLLAAWGACDDEESFVD